MAPRPGARRGPNSTLLAAAGALLALLVIGLILSLVNRHQNPGPTASRTQTSSTTTVASSTETPTPRETSPTPKVTPSETETPFRLPLSNYEGDWVPGENVPSKEVLNLLQSKEGLTGATSAYSVELDSADAGEDDLEGLIVLGDVDLEVKGNLSRDSNELRLNVRKESGGRAQWTFHRPYDASHRQPTAEDFSNPETYLPGLYQVRVFSLHLEDDTTAVVTDTSTVVQAGILRSELENYSGQEQVFHYVLRSDGIYRVPDKEPDEAILWLPTDLAIGRKWYDGSYDCEVLAMDEVVDLGFDKFPCLKVKRANAAVEINQTAYYAPGAGEVLVRDTRGYDAVRLTSLTHLQDGGGAEEVRQKALNIDQIAP